MTRTRVSRPDRSVMCTKVSLKEANKCATAKTSSPSTRLLVGSALFLFVLKIVLILFDVCVWWVYVFENII